MDHCYRYANGLGYQSCLCSMSICPFTPFHPLPLTYSKPLLSLIWGIISLRGRGHIESLLVLLLPLFPPPVLSPSSNVRLIPNYHSLISCPCSWSPTSDNWPLNDSLNTLKYFHLMSFHWLSSVLWLGLCLQNLPFLPTLPPCFHIGGYSIYARSSCIFPSLFIVCNYFGYLHLFNHLSLTKKKTPSW